MRAYFMAAEISLTVREPANRLAEAMQVAHRESGCGEFSDEVSRKRLRVVGVTYQIIEHPNGTFEVPKPFLRMLELLMAEPSLRECLDQAISIFAYDKMHHWNLVMPPIIARYAKAADARIWLDFCD